MKSFSISTFVWVFSETYFTARCTIISCPQGLRMKSTNKMNRIIRTAKILAMILKNLYFLDFDFFSSFFSKAIFGSHQKYENSFILYSMIRLSSSLFATKLCLKLIIEIEHFSFLIIHQCEGLFCILNLYYK